MRFACAMIMTLGISMTATLVCHAQPPGQGRNDRQGGGQGPGAPFPAPPSPPLLEALDTNKDGVLSASEIKNADKALRGLDKNKDGVLADTELTPVFDPRRGNGRNRGGNPFGGPRGNAPTGNSGASGRLRPDQVQPRDGAATLKDHAAFQALSYKGDEVMIDTFLAGLEFVKFQIESARSDDPQMYFINTKTHRAHMRFSSAVGLPRSRGGGDQMKGVLVYRPMLESPNGTPGLFTFEFEPFDTYAFDMIKIAFDLLVTKMPLLEGKLGYYPRDRGIEPYERDKALYAKSSIRVYQESDLSNTAIGYLPLNTGRSYGLLRLMNLDERPGPRDVVLYKTLPNEMPRVAGIITAVRQTPLSHVNLRAIQDKVPNAFITDAWKDAKIAKLIGKYVSYKVTEDGYDIHAADMKDVEAHFAAVRPTKAQTPKRDLSVTRIRDLKDISFTDSVSFGVKTSNIATMKTFGFDDSVVPDGFGIPFHFYDEFMKQNGFYGYAKNLLANSQFRSDRAVQETELKKFRALIKKGKMSQSMMDVLDRLHKSFPAGTSVRMRSSTNNEDLPGFSGAGLYDSFTHKKDEGHIAKSVKQVYASLWNFRAFEEREFYRVDHLAAAMGILVHSNFKDELANGVAVTDDILYATEGNYYLNTQVGEDLVTNPNEESIPEELLLDWWKSSKDKMIQSSNRVTDSKRIVASRELEQLRECLGILHAKFAKLYGTTLDDDRFAMEIEFKITKHGHLSIKQARPWVYTSSTTTAAN